jgi:hypothetical protein
VKYDGNQVLRDFDGKAMEDEAGKPFTFKAVVLKTLTTGHPSDAEGQAKFRAYQLALKLAADKSHVVNLSVDEVSLVKDRAGRIWINPVMVGRIWDALEKPMPDAPAADKAPAAPKAN